MKYSHRVTSCLAMLLALSLFSSTAAAQDGNEIDESSIAMLYSTTISMAFLPYTIVGGALVTTTGLGVTATVVLTREQQKTSTEVIAIRTYIRHNPVAISESLYMGGGLAADDLANLFGVEHSERDRFARALRDGRTQLEPLVATTITTEETLLFISAVQDQWAKQETLALMH